MAKSKYVSHVLPKLGLVEGWAREGMIERDMAAKLGVSYSSFADYKNRFPDFLEALKRGKEVVDFEVENALLKRALGYAYVEERVEVSDKDGEKVTKTVKQVAPDVTAQIFWLKNRKPGKWRDKPDSADSEGESGGVVVLSPVMENHGHPALEEGAVDG